MQRWVSQVTLLTMTLCGGPLAHGEERPAASPQTKAPPNFEEHVKPILRRHCLKCHGDDKQESGLNLQTHGALLRGGSGGKIVEPGRSGQSRLIDVLIDPDEGARMPPNSAPLPADQVDILRRWIDGGARETAGGKSLAKSRDLAFVPPAAAGQNAGPAVMPEKWPEIEVPKTVRPLAVLSVATSPRAPVAAAAALEHVRLFHTDSGDEIARLPFPEGEPHVLRFSRDGALLMVAGGRPVEAGVVALFDVRTGRRVAEVGDEVDAVLAADVSPDLTLVALGGSGRVAKILSTRDGELRHTLVKHTDWITSLAFSPDGSRLVTGDRAGGIHLWDVATGGIVLNLADHMGAIRALDWRGDSKMLASAGEDGLIVWWDVTDGFPAVRRPNAHPPVRPAGTYGNIPGGVLSVRFDAAGRLVSCGRDRLVRVWGPDGNELKSIPNPEATPLSTAFSADGRKVVVGDALGRVRVVGWE